MNKVGLIGRLTKDPELKFTPGTGTAVATFTLAVNRRYKREGQPKADFIPVVVWGKMAESTANYMSKGRQLAVVGRIETRSYEAKDGTRRYITEVVAEEVDFIDFAGTSNAVPLNNQGQGQTEQEIPANYFGEDANYTEVENEDDPF